MKIAVSAMGIDLDAQVDPRFGRCQYFIIADSDTLEFEALENPNISAMGGAGIQSGQLMAEKGVQVILTGNVGPNAFQILSAAGLQIITGVTGTVRSAIQGFKSGQFQPVSGATVPTHSGIGVGVGNFPEAGMGRGGGRWNVIRPVMQSSPEQELQMLKNQAEAMRQQLDQIANRIQDMEQKSNENNHTC